MTRAHERMVSRRSGSAHRRVGAIALSTLALSALAAGLAFAGDGVTTCRAVLVGISDFTGTGSDLNYCDDDARDMQAALLTSPNWLAANITLLVDTAATKTAIQSAIAAMVAAADDDDLILLFYSSHGSQIADQAPLDEPDGMDETLVTTELVDLVDDELATWLQPAVTSKICILIDACFSGGQIKGLSGGGRVKSINPNPAPPNVGNGLTEDLQRVLAPVGTRDLDDNSVGVVVTACDGDELSVEGFDIQNGAFTEYLLQAITNTGLGYPADANANQSVSGEEVYTYAYPLTVAYNPTQHPQIFDADTTVELDFAGLTGAPPRAPKSVTAIDTPEDDGGSVTVLWSKSADDGKGANDVVSYTVTRSVNLAGPFTNVVTVPKGTTTYADTTVTDGQTYYYSIITRDDEGLQSQSKIAGPVVPRHDRAPDVITNLLVTDTQGDEGGSISLDWYGYSAPADFGQYRIYRSTSQFTNVTETGVTLIDTLTVPGEQSYADGTTTDGVTYWYAVTAVDTFGNERKNVTSKSAVSNPNFTFTYPPGTSIIAIGADTSEKDIGTLFGVTDVGTNGEGGLLLSRWDPTTKQYHRYWEAGGVSDPFLQQALGRGFWLTNADAVMLSVSGQPAPAGNFGIPFLAGWNMLGNPYTTDCDLTGTTVTVGTETVPLAQAPIKRWACDYMWRYDAFLRSYKLVSPDFPETIAEHAIRRGQGVFFNASVAGTITLPRPGDAALPSAAAEPAKPVPVDWKFALTAECAAGADMDNFVGVSAASSRLNAIVGPPAVGVDLYFTGPGGMRTAASFGEPGEAPVDRPFIVVAQTAGPVTLRWPDLTAVPKDLKPVLVDTATGRRTYMRTTPAYTYTAEAGVQRGFRLELSPVGAGALVVQGLAAVPTAAGAQVVFTLNRDAAVGVEIMNVAGRKVRTLVADKPVTGGQMTTLTWDGKSTAGTRAPAGRYLVTVTATTEDGQSVKSVRVLSLR